MIPIYDENPTLRTPVVTIAILLAMGLAWVLVQAAGVDGFILAASVCNWGLVPAELTKSAPVGTGILMGPELACVVDADPINWLTPVTSMFLHGGWGHLLGNALFLWIFGNNVEDSMGRARFFGFYLLCGLAAAVAHTFADPGSPVPMVGASGAISGVLGGYLILYPRVRVHLLVLFLFVIAVPAWLMLGYWFGLQLLFGVADFGSEGGVAFWAHAGGFVAGAALIKVFARPELMHPNHG